MMFPSFGRIFHGFFPMFDAGSGRRLTSLYQRKAMSPGSRRRKASHSAIPPIPCSPWSSKGVSWGFHGWVTSKSSLFVGRNPMNQRIGWRCWRVKKSGKPHIFHGKIDGFRWRLSLKTNPLNRCVHIVSNTASLCRYIINFGIFYKWERQCILVCVPFLFLGMIIILCAGAPSKREKRCIMFLSGKPGLNSPWLTVVKLWFLLGSPKRQTKRVQDEKDNVSSIISGFPTELVSTLSCDFSSP